jgi:pyrroline-5-carboxylate reductase
VQNESGSVKHLNICFLGSGSMAEAIVRGLLDRSQADPARITMTVRNNAARLVEMRERYGVRTAADEEAKRIAVSEADMLLLAVKPKDAAAAITQIKPYVLKKPLVISVVAGLTIRAIEQRMGMDISIVRTMPNTSSSIGLGATGVAFSSNCSEADKRRALTVFESIGEVAVVCEELLDTVTGVSGSGPAYFYYVMEAIIEAGIRGGLSPEDARRLTVETALGAAMMVKRTGEAPEELRRKVTSPNGTTQAAVEVLERYRCREAIAEAVLRAAERADELGREIGGS